MKVTMRMDVSDKAAKATLENSIERVINTTLAILEDGEHSGVLEDWLESKQVIVDLWRSLQDALFRRANGLPEQE